MLIYVSYIILSVLFAFVSIVFRQSYIDGQKTTVKQAFCLQKIFSTVLFLSYISASIATVVFYQKKNLTVTESLQCLILWEGIFLISSIDIKIKKIPNKILVILFFVRIAGIICEIMIDGDDFISIISASVFGMLIGIFMVLLVFFTSKGQIGTGDLKLFGVIGLYFGATGLIQITMYTLFPAAFFSIFLLILKKAKMKSTIPMAPFILLGLTVFYTFI